MKKRKRTTSDGEDSTAAVVIPASRRSAIALREVFGSGEIGSGPPPIQRRSSNRCVPDGKSCSSKSVSGCTTNRKRMCIGSHTTRPVEEMSHIDQGAPETLVSENNVKTHLLPSEENAMLNELVLVSLMRFLSIRELTKNRLVCHTWNSEATKFIKRRRIVEIYEQGSRQSIAQFIDSMKYFSVMPFGRFDVVFEKKILKKLPRSYRTFFLLFGQFIDYLILTFFRDWEINLSIHEFRNFFLLTIPNITSLELDMPVKTTSAPGIWTKNKRIQFHRLRNILIRDYLSEKHNLSVPNFNARYSMGFLSDLWDSAPLLDKFTLVTKSYNLMSRVVQSLQKLRLNNTPLTQLILDGIVCDNDINRLNECDFKLRVIRLKYLKKDVQKPTLERFLEINKKTIEELGLGDHCVFYPPPQEDPDRFNVIFPKMEKLKDLRFIRSSICPGEGHGKFFVTSALITEFPVLTKLSFDNDFPGCFQHIEDFFPDSTKQCLTLKEITTTCGIVDQSVLEKICKYYPRLCKLYLTRTPMTMVKIICERLLNLETIYFFLPTFLCEKGNHIGSVCIELDVKNCEKICILLTHYRSCTPPSPPNSIIVFYKPSIGLLKNVQMLEVETSLLDDAVQDCGILLTFKDLKVLYFESKLSDQYRQYLSELLPNASIVDGNS